MSAAGEGVSAAGEGVSAAGEGVSTGGEGVSAAGEGVSAGGEGVSAADGFEGLSDIIALLIRNNGIGNVGSKNKIVGTRASSN